MNIDHLQLDLIKKSKNYISRVNQSGLDTSSFAGTYLITAYSQGYFTLKYFIHGKKNLLNKFYVYLKSLYLIRKLYGYKIYNDNNKHNFKRIVVSWSKNDDFLDDGSYNDRYFKTNSNENKEVLWFLMSVDNKFPKKIAENIIVLYKKKNNEQNLVYLMKIFFVNLFKYKFSIRKFLASLSFYSHISEIIFEKIKPLILQNHFKAIIVPYESQPFQNYLFKNIKKLKKNIKTIGYVSSTQPLPLYNLHRDGAPEKIFVHGSDQKFHLTNYFGWPDETVKLIPSLRFKKEDKLEIENKIFLPYYITNSKIYLREFERLLCSLDKKIKPLTIINHPLMVNSKSHLNLKKKLYYLLELHKNIFSETSEQSEIVFFGATSLVIEALERNYKFTHICSEPILESFSKAIWPSISVTKINDYVFKYSLKNFGSCVKLGVENNMFQKYCID